MFESYDERARRTILFARYEAAQIRSPEILPEHILLGLLKEEPSVASGIVSGSAQQIREEILAYLLQYERQSPLPAEMPLSRESQELLTEAEEEAKKLAHSRMNNHHILWALMRMENCFAARVLRRNGIALDQLRMQMLTLHKATEEPGPETVNISLSASDRKFSDLERRVMELFRLNDHRGALKLVDDAVADPGLDRNQTTRGLVQIASVIARILGDLDLVKRYCEIRLDCNPDDATALYELADSLALQGKTEDATRTAIRSYKLTLEQSTAESRSLAELIEHRFPKIKSRT